MVDGTASLGRLVQFNVISDTSWTEKRTARGTGGNIYVALWCMLLACKKEGLLMEVLFELFSFGRRVLCTVLVRGQLVVWT